MIVSLLTKLDNLERPVRTSFGRDISSRSGRFWAHIHFHLMDHAFLRVLWNNFHQVSDEVYRANQPSPSHLRSYKDRGIKAKFLLVGGIDYDYPNFVENNLFQKFRHDIIKFLRSGFLRRNSVVRSSEAVIRVRNRSDDSGG